MRRATAADPAARHADARELLDDFERRTRRFRPGFVALVATPAAATLLALVGLLVEPPRGPRASTDVWGGDAVPASAWNVARDPSGTRIELRASHLAYACGQSIGDLLDGITHYHDWKRGFAFPMEPPGVCVGLDLLGVCGPVQPRAHLCRRDRDGPGAPLDETVATADGASPERRRALGQWSDGVPCGERWLEVALDGEYAVRAVRVWHHQNEHVPAEQHVLVAEGAGWREVFKAFDLKPTGGVWHETPPLNYWSGPVTLDFTPIRARRVRWVMNSCTTDRARGGHGWIYEIEVFADISRLDAGAGAFFSAIDTGRGHSTPARSASLS